MRPVPPSLESMIRKRPFVPLAMLLIAGIVLTRTTGMELAWWVAAALPLLALELFAPLRWPAHAVLLLLLGGAIYSARYQVWSEDDLRLTAPAKAAIVTLRGRLEETPSVREFYAGERKMENSSARFRVSEMLSERRWRAATGEIFITSRGE